jgi:hypothetical protein
MQSIKCRLKYKAKQLCKMRLSHQQFRILKMSFLREQFRAEMRAFRRQYRRVFLTQNEESYQHCLHSLRAGRPWTGRFGAFAAVYRAQVAKS